jgi:Xaa-Pro aminopeptidase
VSAAPPAAHPDALVAFMMKDWAPRDPKVLPREHVEIFRARRQKLSRRFLGDLLVIPTGHEKTRANDTTYRFRPGSDFFYLTGNLEPDCVLVLVPNARGGHDHVLFVEPNPGRSDKTFFTDHSKGELWVGPRLGVKESAIRFGFRHAKGLPELAAFLSSESKKLSKKRRARVRVLTGFSSSLDGFLGRPHRHADSARGDLSPAPNEADAELAAFLSELRLIKDELEIAELEQVTRSTKRAFEDVIVALATARTEREVEGTFNLTARVLGNDVGYGTIAASGANACILHWTRNDAKLGPRDLLLLDAGVEGHQLYTADITRTLPISGKFSPAQREVYDLVCRAQKAALGAVKPGNDFMEPNRRAQRVLAEGLVAMGILKDAERALAPDQQLQKRYTLHNTSHMLGIDVHDCAKARNEVYRYGKLLPGMVLTVEPGLYFQPDDLTVPKKYRGIGVRIEDDVLVTDTGMRNLSGSIPRDADAVERWMATLWGRAKVRRRHDRLASAR